MEIGGGLEAQLAQSVQVSPDALLQRGREDRLWEERAEPRAPAGPLLLDYAEGAELPYEVGQPLGEVGAHADGELPVAGG